jgi:hypothetical protein
MIVSLNFSLCNRVRQLSKAPATYCLLAAIVSSTWSCHAYAEPAQPKIFLGYIQRDQDPAHEPVLLIRTLEQLSTLLGGHANRKVLPLPDNWTISSGWPALAAEYSHFVVGRADATSEMQGRYTQITWLVGKIMRSEDGAPHLTYYGGLFASIWMDKQNSGIFSYECFPKNQVIFNGLATCMREITAPEAANVIRRLIVRIFPDLRDKYFFSMQCLNATDEIFDDAVDITRGLWDSLSEMLGTPSTNFWVNERLLRRFCHNPEIPLDPQIAQRDPDRDPEFEIAGSYGSNKFLNLKISNFIGDRRDNEMQKFGFGDDLTSAEAHRWQEQLEIWRYRRIRCKVASDSQADWPELTRELAPHLTSIILSRANLDMARQHWDCAP